MIKWNRLERIFLKKNNIGGVKLDVRTITWKSKQVQITLAKLKIRHYMELAQWWKMITYFTETDETDGWLFQGHITTLQWST